MSYILSALKKAEQERHGGNVPNLMTAQTVDKATPLVVKRKPYLIGGLAVSLLLALWLLGALRSGGILDGVIGDALTQRETRTPLIEPAAPASSGQPTNKAANKSGVGGDTPAVAIKSTPAEATPGSTPEPFDNLVGDEPHFGTSPADDAGAAPKAAPKEEGRAAPKEEIRAAPKEEIRATSKVRPSTSQLAGDIPDITELPASLRRQIPRLELTGHLYSLAHPKARKVILNGVASREKQYLDDDLMISEITADGVILEFQGRLFRMNADQMFR